MTFLRQHSLGFIIPFFRYSIQIAADFFKKKPPDAMMFIRVADNARACGLYGISLRLTDLAEKYCQTDSSMFWCLQVRATSLQYMFCYKKSNRWFKQAIKTAASEYEKSFSLQHYAKSLVEQEKYVQAEKLFLQALEIRKKYCDENLVKSTENALLALNIKKKI